MKNDLEQFYETYDSMISGTFAEQETAAAVFLTTSQPRLTSRLSETANHRLRRALGSATNLANSIRHNQRATAEDLLYHRSQQQWIKEIVERVECKASTNPEAARGNHAEKTRPIVAIAASAAALIAFLFIVRPRGTLLWRWLRKRTIRRDLHMILQVQVEEDGKDPNQVRVRGIDVTEGGMQLFWPGGAPEAGCRVTVLLPDIEKPGAVVWSNTFVSGIAFDEQLATDQVKVLAAEAKKSRIATG